MTIDLYQVDAFASQVFKGNPAAVCPLDEWLSDEKMQNIALENNLSETAFFVKQDDTYRLRWFTPEVEVDLCGHATLASVHVLFDHLGYDKDEIYFDSNSGILKVSQEDDKVKMDFPATIGEQISPPKKLLEALGTTSDLVFKATDYMVVLGNEEKVKNLSPNFFLLKEVDTRGVIVTAPGTDVDFVSRFFAPAVGIDEDPVTGSAHTMMTPYWSDYLNKKGLSASQLSKRGGFVHCRMMENNRVGLAGYAKTYLVGHIEV